MECYKLDLKSSKKPYNAAQLTPLVIENRDNDSLNSELLLFKF